MEAEKVCKMNQMDRYCFFLIIKLRINSNTIKTPKMEKNAAALGRQNDLSSEHGIPPMIAINGTVRSFAVHTLISGRYFKPGSIADRLAQRMISMFASRTCIRC